MAPGSRRAAGRDTLTTSVGAVLTCPHPSDRARAMDLELKDNVAVVTGASKGIGLAVVRMLAAEGAFVIGGALTADSLAESIACPRSRWIWSSPAAPSGWCARQLRSTG